MKYDVIGFGESVVDFIPVGIEDGCTVYKACPGGSVANLCVVTARLGGKSAFVGGIGEDEFGNFLKRHIFGLCPFASVNYINGEAPDPEKECERYLKQGRE